MVGLGTPMPSFSLPDTAGRTWSSSYWTESPCLLVVFMCNHCPYVIRVEQQLAELGRDAKQLGFAMVGINSNDVENYPDDAPARMAEKVKEVGYTFPYLYDETQEVARAFHAACTPDLFLYDRQRRLAYRGQLDAARPSNEVPSDGASIRTAIADVLAGRPVSIEQIPSLGCNIKWKPGNEPS